MTSDVICQTFGYRSTAKKLRDLDAPDIRDPSQVVPTMSTIITFSACCLAIRAGVPPADVFGGCAPAHTRALHGTRAHGGAIQFEEEFRRSRTNRPVTCSNEQGVLPLLGLDQVGKESERITGKCRCHFEGEIDLISVPCSQVSANSGKRGIKLRAIDRWRRRSERVIAAGFGLRHRASCRGSKARTRPRVVVGLPGASGIRMRTRFVSQETDRVQLAVAVSRSTSARTERTESAASHSTTSAGSVNDRQLSALSCRKTSACERTCQHYRAPNPTRRIARRCSAKFSSVFPPSPAARR